MVVDASPVEGKGDTKPTYELTSVTVRFAGDSGDGMQLAGTQFTNASAIFGNDIATLPDFPAEIRAPAGSLAGVSGFQINFASHAIHTPGDEVQTLVAMNPAALKANLPDLEKRGLLIVNEDAFDKSGLSKAGYDANPLENGELEGYRLFKIPIGRQNREALADTGLGAKAIDRCKNFFALGLVFWLYDRPLEPTLHWIEQKFGKVPEVAEANRKALKQGYFFGETAEIFDARYHVAPAPIEPGRYRKITGNEGLALGLITACRQADTPLFYASYPITPASDILHELARHKNFGVKTFQAEDEIAAIGAAIGASFAGQFGMTGTSGPGLCLKSEALGLAVMTELPVVVIVVQRGGPSTGLPTKTEQSDLLQAMFGRNGECPVPVLAPSTPANCFDTAIEAVRIAAKFMTPVLVLSDGYLGTGAEPWKIPDVAALPKIELNHPTDPETYQPYARDEVNARPWAVPGTPGLEHRLGGLEKANITGNVSYDPDNHEAMTHLREAKVAGIADHIPEAEVDGPESGDLLVVSWGGTYGAVVSAGIAAREKGLSVANLHLRYLNPFPRNVGEILARYDKILVCELNLGQLRTLLTRKYPVQPLGLHKVKGKPFMISEVLSAIERTLDGDPPASTATSTSASERQS
jgi:2-oxoglutarate ferredoxin oxidoreductase subunit alpha